MRRELDVFDTDLSQMVWKEKYKAKTDNTLHDTFHRVVNALFPSTRDAHLRERMRVFLRQGKVLPAGRIISGAGTGNRVTLMNCYVMGTLEDSLDDIFQKLKESALTMQQGGGIGIDFTPLRPTKALLKRTGSFSSGPLPFMDAWDAMCRTIMSAGHRRGAMMATMKITHPNIIDFIKAKRTQGRLTNFNVSVLVTDDFMECLGNGDMWDLYHTVPHADWSPEELITRRRIINGESVYIYDTMPAKDLWDLLLQNTYEYSEPGVIFIDRINKVSNLSSIENIQCTNPCGEQPLPPYGACDLGHINLAMFVNDPYTNDAQINWKELIRAVHIMVRALNAAMDITEYPLAEQREEQLNKRRIGLGVTGLADALAMLNVAYGSEGAINHTRKIMSFIAVHAYDESCTMAENGLPAPAFNPDLFNYRFIKWATTTAADLHSKDYLPVDLLKRIRKHGLTNCVLLTVAPTGTTSAFYGNVSSGCEPTFAHRMTRKVRQLDDTFKSYTEYSFLVRHYAHVHDISLEAAYEAITNGPWYPTTESLNVTAHVYMQAAVQEFIDASVSKTVNCPPNMTFEDFRQVYDMAWAKGCKGCTTYRPSEVRGSILEVAKSDKQVAKIEKSVAGPVVTPASSSVLDSAARGVQVKKRDRVLEGRTYKIDWPGLAAAIYITINHNDAGQPEEVFISSKNSQYAEWSVALSVMISKLMKLTQNPYMVSEELQQINLSMNPAWVKGKFYGSVISQIGAIIKEHADEFADMAYIEHYTEELSKVTGAEMVLPAPSETLEVVPEEMGKQENTRGKQCPACGSPNLVMKEGCLTCADCGQSKCG